MPRAGPTSKGRPASGIGITLERLVSGVWTKAGAGTTNDDGRVKSMLPDGEAITAGTYRLTFATGDYFAQQATRGFYPEVSITFEVVNPAEHFHVPLLLNPYGFSTYRGS